MLNEQAIRKLLKSHGLRITSARLAVIEILKNSPSALSQTDIEEKLSIKPDRVTLYRLFKDLEDAGIIHRLFDMAGLTKFALCHDCEEHDHNDEHIHFSCTECNKTFCLDQVGLPNLNIPGGYKVKHMHLNLEGICKTCNN